VVEQEILITLRFNLATGKAGLNESVYKLKQLRDPLMLKILEQTLIGCDDIISERLSRTKIYRSKASKNLGQHLRRGDDELMTIQDLSVHSLITTTQRCCRVSNGKVQRLLQGNGSSDAEDGKNQFAC
jgi:hypothetical protein